MLAVSVPARETLTLRLRDMMVEANEPSMYVYFPLTLMASFVRELSNGSTIEVGVAGYEGVVGLDVCFGAKAQPNAVTTQIAGDVIRVGAADAKAAFENDQQFRHLILLFSNAFTIQVGQTAACNRLHPLEQRLARWLLMVDDRTPDLSSFAITQEFLAQMLGTRTAGVNEAVSTLTASGLIRHRRQLIEVVDRGGLEVASCECYETVRIQYSRDLVM